MGFELPLLPRESQRSRDLLLLGRPGRAPRAIRTEHALIKRNPLPPKGQVGGIHAVDLADERQA
eukprot:3318835-Pyramimonas_sp.AAC.1